MPRRPTPHRLLRRAAAALLACALLAAPAFADNTADESDVAFGLGNQHFAKRDYERALQQYFLSYRLVPNRNVLFNIARCYEALDRFDEAYRYWHDLFVDKGLPDDDRREVKQALGRLAPRVALVTVASTPPGADLFVDREDLGSRGKTPQTIAVAPGAHTVIVKLEGHRTASSKASTARGRDVKLALELTRIVGTVELTGTPPGAVVRETADGPELGRLPASLAFTPGQKLLVVQAPGYLPSQVLVEVKADATATAKVALTEKPKPTGKVIVTANRDAALVRVDGRDSGFTPVVLTLPEGEHTVEVSASEVLPLSRTFTVVEGSEERFAAELRYAPPAVQAASKSKLTVDQAPASVTVITREELQGFGYQTLAEALQAVRGFFLTDDRIYTYLGLRGFAPSGDLNTRILVLWDGHPINDVWAGQGFAERGLDVDLVEVDRIEVVRGPASLLFGTGALFGVVNVVPRERLAPRHVEGTAGAGGQGGVKARVAGSLSGEGLSALVSAAGFTSTGADLTDVGATRPVQGYDGERALGATLRARAGGLTLSGKINQRRKQVPTGFRAEDPSLNGSDYLDARAFAEARFEHDFGRVALTARASYDASRFEGYYMYPDEDGVFRRWPDLGGGDWFGGEVRAGVTLFGQNRLTASFEGQYQLVYQHPVDGVRESFTRVLLSGTVLDEWQATSWLFVQAGVRVDKYLDLPGVALSPRGALVLKPYASGITRLVAGQAFRAPNVYELNYNDSNLSARKPDSLATELITTFELEHSHDVTPELRATVGGYYNLMDRLVELLEEDAATPACGTPGNEVQCLVYVNSGRRLTALGAEAELRWQPGRFTLVDASYAFVLLGGAPREELPVYPAHLASLRAMVPLKEGLVRLSTQLVFQSARGATPQTAQGEALLVNFGLSGEYGALRYFAGVQNVLDQRYVLPISNEVGLGAIRQYGRTFWLEASAGF